MKDNINLWFVDGAKKKRVPQVFSKVLLNFMLGRYPTSVFEKFSKHRLEYLLEELLTKITDKNFFSEIKPIWWPDSIEFVPIPVLRQKIARNVLTWILHLQELLLSAREFYAEQLYLSRKSYKNFNIMKINKVKRKSEKAKPPKVDVKIIPKKTKCFIKISPSIFKPIRNENTHPNIPMSDVKTVSHFHCPIDRKPFAQCEEDLSKKVAIDRHIGMHKELISSVQESFGQLEDLLKRTSMYVPVSTSTSQFSDAGWKPYVYLDDILRKQSLNNSIDLKLYRSINCRVDVFDILKPVSPTVIEKTSYMSRLGLEITSTTLYQKIEDIPRTVNYKKYSPSVPFSSKGGQMIIDSLKERYQYNSNCERIGRRGCSINDPLRQKIENRISINEDTNCFTRENKIKSYHVYKFCRRRPLNSSVLPQKIWNQYCRSMTVNVERLSPDILETYIKNCKVILSRTM